MCPRILERKERKRRWLEQDQSDSQLSYQEILGDINRRDDFDGSRLHSPMKPAADAVQIDTTGLTKAQVIEKILELEIFRA